MSLVRGTVSGQMLIWDVNTMAWVPWDGSLTTGALTIGTVNQGTGGASAWKTDSTASYRLTVALDFNGGSNPVYIGIAAPGSSQGAAAWQIRKLTYDGSSNPTDIQYAGGSTAFTNVWTNRASLSYS
jgi:hypothetical protein